MTVILVVGVEEGLVEEALERAGEDGDVVVLDSSATALERLERAVLDPRVWFLMGDAEVVPLPDASVDEVLGGASADLDRVLR